MTIDSHFHSLSMHRKGMVPDLEGLTGIDAGTDPGDYAERISLLPPIPSIFASAGAGPWCLDSSTLSISQMIDQLYDDIMRYNLDAIGECGIDNHWGYGTPESQQELYIRQAELADHLSLPLIIHSREAEKEIREAMMSSSPERAVLHCFSYSEEIAFKAIDRGWYISFAGNITYGSSEALRRTAAAIPDDRLLVETDSPYLAPVPYRGKPAVPQHADTTLEFIADLRGADPEELKAKVIGNLFSFLSRDKSVRKMRLSCPD